MSTARAHVIDRPATYEDYLALPEGTRVELMDGVLHTSPAPRLRHGYSASAINGTLWNGFGGGHPPGEPGGWLFAIEPELHLGRPVPTTRVLVPDLAGWRRERAPVDRAGVGVQLVPDWVCEVLSPSTASVDRLKKSRIYGESGVAHLWLVDPAERRLEVYRNVEGLFAMVGGGAGGDRVRAEPFEAVELDLSKWWIGEAPAADGPEGVAEAAMAYTP